MSSGSVSRRYAKALYELARDEQSVVAVRAALAAIAEGLEEAGRDRFGRGVLDAASRRRVGDALADRVGRESLVGRFIRLVAERDRIDELPTIAEWFAKLEDRDAGRVRLEIRAPAELSQAEVAGVCQAFRELAGGEVVAQVRTDPGLLGGAVVELEGRVFDGSIKTALERLALRMAGSASAAGA